MKGERERGQDEIRAHTAENPNPRVLRPGSLSPSPLRSQHPHHDAGITPGRHSPPSAPPAAAPSSFASSPPPQLSGGHGQWAQAESPGAPGGARTWGPGTDGSDGGGGGGGGGDGGGAPSPVSSTTSSRLGQPRPPGGRPAALLRPALGDLPLRHRRQEGRVCHRLAGSAPAPRSCGRRERWASGRRAGGGRRGAGGGVGGAGKGGRGRSWKMAELPSGSVSQSRGLRDPPGSPAPG